MAINLGSLKKAAPKDKKEKPLLPDPDGSFAVLVSAGITARQHVDAHELALKQTNDELGRATLSHAFALFHGRSAGIEDSFQVRTVGGKAMVSLKNAYKVPEDLAPVVAILGEELAGKVLRKTFTISIDSDAIPEFVLQSFIDELTKLARSVDSIIGTAEGTDGPVFNAISVKEKVSVVKSFHEERHTLLTPDQNLQLQAVLPCVVSVRYDY
jgi:hypothetical protein